MKPVSTSIHPGNLQEFLESAENATDVGQAQFFTPGPLAQALFTALPHGRRFFNFDLHFGAGALAAASGARHCMGLDIDARVKRLASKAPEGSTWQLAQADLTQWYPLARDVNLSVPFITINPPFSLQWHADRLAPLLTSQLPQVAECAAAYPDTIDSTLASFLIALDLLQERGEGFLVCNAATARRFLGSPDGATPGRHPSLRSFIWLWLEIEAPVFDNIRHEFDTAVLYFSRSRGGYHRQTEPHFITSPSADPVEIANLLALHATHHITPYGRLNFDYEVTIRESVARFDLIAGEYAVRHGGKIPDWNIRLDPQGKIRTHLTPFQKTNARLDRTLVERLHSLDGQSPIALCVTATSRTALREAAECGVWTVHPDVPAAIAAAVEEYAAQGAPFYTPNATQALGWIDEFSRLTCSTAGIGSCRPGSAYKIDTKIEETTWLGSHVNLAGETERLEYKGKEMLVILTDDSACQHHFHVRRDDAKHEDTTDEHGKVTRRHWFIADLLSHFEIPIPPDLATLRPLEYAENLAVMRRLEERINRCLGVAA